MYTTANSKDPSSTLDFNSPTFVMFSAHIFMLFYFIFIFPSFFPTSFGLSNILNFTDAQFQHRNLQYPCKLFVFQIRRILVFIHYTWFFCDGCSLFLIQFSIFPDSQFSCNFSRLLQFLPTPSISLPQLISTSSPLLNSLTRRFLNFCASYSHSGKGWECGNFFSMLICSYQIGKLKSLFFNPIS